MHKQKIRFNFSDTYILEDDVVKLVSLEVEHIKSLLEISNDPNIWMYFFEKGNEIENLTKYVKSAIENRRRKKEYPFVVFDKRKNRYAGSTRFYEFIPDLNTIKLGHTWYGKEFRGTGLNKHCKYLLFEFTFEKLGLERIGFGAYVENEISIAAMTSVGCKKEGILRGFFPSLNGKGRTDAIVLGILKKEWNENVKYELKNKLNKV
ncbi:GNAT family N-acetyltransferase [Aquimarina sp. AU119]|uniref:GNAT family N-acetyltransferase n=1 Tax=Aquimarina sp. AU119 TaxID=2108528 RepID=UPI000D697A0A|nr:GNAT family protein [Aquimarina sp. AU119]